ncbi:hypothetical protein GOP47_0026424 [Adiantum capillus-veneris]|nr:hypothetical protein GOP47_0026424 [Adiantum capillus-veneris]
MATMSASLAVSAPSCPPAEQSLSQKSFSGLKATTLFALKCGNPLALSNGSRISAMLVWKPYNNKKFETLSYLPQLSSEQIAKQVDYMVRQNFTPCIEFDNIGSVYREHFHGSGYYDGRYWVMWKLPMFGCTDSAAVLREITECAKEYPKAFIRVLGFDAKRQVQVAGFLVQKPGQ